MHIESSGRMLAASLVGGRGTPGPAVLFLHGLHSDQAGYRPRAALLADRLGATCLTFDLGGHGESDGDSGALSPRDHLGDALAAYDALVASDSVDPGRVGVCAASYGGYLAAILTGHRPVRRLVLRAPALYADRWFETAARDREPFGEIDRDSIALRSLRSYAGEVLVVEGGADEVIPKPMVEAYLDACVKGRGAVIPQATHRLGDPAWEAEYRRLMLEFFTGL